MKQLFPGRYSRHVVGGLLIIVLLGLNGWLVMRHLHWPHKNVSTGPSAIHLTYGPNGVPKEGTLIIKKSGNGNGYTKTFKVPKDWHAYWHFGCNIEREAGNFKLTVYDAHKKKSISKPVIAYGSAGYGDDHQHTAGTFFISISATQGCTWDVIVKTLPH